MVAAKPINEAGRIAALEKYAILDTDPEQSFDDFTLLASFVCRTPIALISLVDEDRQWFKSRVGIDASETSRDIAFCSTAILQSDLFVVPDARLDERFRDNPLVASDAYIRFYAGAPLINKDGYALGTLCVVDRSPRELAPEQREALKALSRLVIGSARIPSQFASVERSSYRPHQGRTRTSARTGPRPGKPDARDGTAPTVSLETSAVSITPHVTKGGKVGPGAEAATASWLRAAFGVLTAAKDESIALAPAGRTSVRLDKCKESLYLHVALSFDTREQGGLQTSPIIVESVLYGITPTQKIFALDAATGKPLWKFDSGMRGTQPDRGLAYWSDGKDKRILVGVMNFVYALDATTGSPIASFGDDGRIDLRENLGREPASSVSVDLTSPAVVYKDLLIVGGRNPETLPAQIGRASCRERV